MDISTEDRLRADFYNFPGFIIGRPHQISFCWPKMAGLSGDETDLGQAIQAMARVAKVTKPAAAEREFNTLFIGLGRGELLPYASFYLTGFPERKTFGATA